jgi:hypothetical protein
MVNGNALVDIYAKFVGLGSNSEELPKCNSRKQLVTND